MRAWGWVILGTLACRHTAPVGFDPNLPEDVDEIEVQTPRQILDDEAAGLNPSLRAVALGLVLEVDWGPDWDARALGDPSGWVQRAAVEALAARNSASAEAQLVAFIQEPSRDPVARANAALRMPDNQSATSAIRDAWRAEAVAWRQAPLALAALTHGDQEARAPLSSSIRRGELPFEVELFYEIGRSADGALVAPLRNAQRLVEPELQLAVAAARWMLGDSTAEEPFRKAVAGDDVERRLEALDYLVRLDREQVRGLLVKARSRGPDLVTWYADLALAAAAGADPALFEKAATDPDREVRELAVRFASEVASSAEPNRRLMRVAREVLLEALSDPHATVRIEALRAIRLTEMTEAADAVSTMLTDDNRMVRLEASGTALLLDDA